MAEGNTQQVVYTHEARCRDCYRCVRVCPIKAIRIDDGQAFVDPDRCISCGTCVRECPQGAKTFRRDLDKAEALVAQHAFVAVSLAPSFAGVFSPGQYARIPGALRALGFEYVAETAVGAYLVAQKTAACAQNTPHTSICTACPAVVTYIEKYEPAKIGNLLPVVSPMIAHARHIKEKFGPEAKVVFIGPCVAKKTEADRPEFKGLVDCVLTFDEFEEWLKRKHMDLDHCAESSFDEEPEGKSRLFPVEGGCMATTALNTSVVDEKLIFVSGFQEMKDVLDAADKGVTPCIVEPLFCAHGCVNGPGVSKIGNLFERRARIIRYAQENPGVAPRVDTKIDLKTIFGAHPPVIVSVKEEEILAVLEKAGKKRKEDQLNCAACGYASCRDQAAAVVQGMAEVEMCIPYMRRLAEQRSDRIIDTSPNGIVVLDDELNILNFNPAFARMFRVSGAFSGKSISHLIDPEPFERVKSGQTDMADDIRVHKMQGVIAREIVYALRAEKQYVGIFINITADHINAERLQKVKDETAVQARELHEHQIEMARQFASFLGEYTAKGEQLVNRLIQAVESKDVIENKKL
jgi:iron only hydrogenase large subunit-like protein